MMTDEDLSMLVTSIDENDIEIIPSYDMERNELLNFLSDNFALNEETETPPVVPIQTVNTITSSTREEPEEYEDETLIERLSGLTEMFPDWLQTFFQNSYQYSKYLGHFMKKSVWFCSSSFLVLLLPILVQLEFSQVAEMQAAQTRQILLGPSAQIGSNPMSTIFSGGQN